LLGRRLKAFWRMTELAAWNIDASGAPISPARVLCRSPAAAGFASTTVPLAASAMITDSDDA